jgi:hypothetical protein
LEKNDDSSFLAAISGKVFKGQLRDAAGETFCVINVGEVEVTAANIVTKLRQRFSDKILVATAINEKSI